MRRLWKLLWMIFIFCVVFFIICDEKWYKIWFENNHVVFNEIKKSDSIKPQLNYNVIYKDSNIIRINPEFKNPKNLRKSEGINSEYLAKLKQKKDLNKEKNKNNEKVYTWPSFLNLHENDSISSVFQWLESDKVKSGNNQKFITWENRQENRQKTWRVQNTIPNQSITWIKMISTWKENTVVNTWKSGGINNETWIIKQEINSDSGDSINETMFNSWEMEPIQTWILETPNKVVVYYPVKEFQHNQLKLNLDRWKVTPKITIEKYLWKWSLNLNMLDSSFFKPIVLYKTNRRIKIYTWFENLEIMRNSSWINEFLSLNQNESQISPTVISLKDDNMISSAWLTEEIETWFISNEKPLETKENSENDNFDNKISINDLEEEYENIDSLKNNIESISWNIENLYTVKKYIFEPHKLNLKNWIYNIEKYEINTHTFDLKSWIAHQDLAKNEHSNPSTNDKINNVNINNTVNINTGDAVIQNINDETFSDDFEEQENLTGSTDKYITIKKPELFRHFLHLYQWKEPEIILITLNKFPSLSKHSLYLKKWRQIKSKFVTEKISEQNESNVVLSDPMVEDLLKNEDIDINTLESENDEFLQKVFQTTRDRDVMNLIVETYLNEYQFVKAKNFIENLPEMYKEDLKPSLILRVTFNSFPLSSKTINENLTEIVQDFSYKNKISKEDEDWYLWIIELMNKNYDKFFTIASWFTSEKYVAFTSKLQWYKDQISKQMWMPEYYFDTLVSLELFNQWFFQPAKVLALYSLQKDSDYILPYQVLAYANFLTNSRDTSIEYLKKLVDIDPNNAEKYRFLMWIAFYRAGKYEQSVVTLSMIKSDNLRLDAQRYLINNYLLLDQKNKLISSRNKLLWYNNLVASDFYTYFYETFFRPYAEWQEFEIYAFDTELANKMIRVCGIILPSEERVVCTYWSIGRNIAVWQFEGLEQYLLNLVSEYPQWYLYHALWEYYIKQWDIDKAKKYLLKAVSMTQKKREISQIKNLLQSVIE